MTVKEFTALLLRALGYDTTGENYGKVMDLAKELGLLNGVTSEETANVVRGTAFVMMYNTLETNAKGEESALVYKLGYKEMPRPETFEVLSVEASGLKTIGIKFSDDFDKESLKNITLKNGSDNVDFDIASVDYFMCRLVLDTVAVQDSVYTVAFDSVKTTYTDKTIDKYEAKVFMTDATRPELPSVEAVDAKTLLVTMSEPINLEENSFKALDQFKINDKALIAKVQSNPKNKGKNQLTLELKDALEPGEYKITVSGLEDYAGFVAKTRDHSFEVRGYY